MATLSEYQAQGNVTSLKRGTTNRSLGGVSVTPTKAVQNRPGTVGQFTQKVGDVAKQIGNLVWSAGAAQNKFLINTPKYIYEDVKPFLKGAAQTLTGELGADISNINGLQNELDDRTQRYTQQYRTGSMSKENYQQALRDISGEYSNLSTQAKDVASQTDRGNIIESAALTAGTILSVGNLELKGVGAGQALEAGGKEELKALISEGSTNLEKQALRLPAVRQLLERNLTTGAERLSSETLNQYIRREGTHVAANIIIKRPLFYQSNIGEAHKVFEGLITGNYPQVLKSSGWLGIQLLDGGPLGTISKGYGWTKGKLRDLSHGKGSFIDELSTRIGNGNSQQVANFLLDTKNQHPDKFRDVEKAFRVFQELNLRTTGDNAGEAVSNLLRTYTDSGTDLTKLTPEQLYEDMNKWQKASQLWNDVSKGGISTLSAEDAARYTPVRWDATTRSAVADAVRNAGDNFQDQWQAVQTIANKPGSSFSNNSNLMNQIEAIFNTGGTKEEIAKAIQAIDAAQVTPHYLPKRLSKQLAELGYTIAEPVGGRKVPHLELDDTRKLVSGAIKGGSDIFDESIAAQPQLSAITGFMERAGISPEATSNQGYKELGRSVAANLQDTAAAQHFGFGTTGDQTKGGQAILSKLQQYIENKPSARFLGGVSASKSAITDIRQLTIKEIQEALGDKVGGRITRLGRDEAKEVYRSIVKGYMDTPLELRGAGDKVVDALFTYNPLQKYYSRIQSALRYTYNPFFRVQESAETAMLSRVQANNLIWGKSRADLEEAVKLLDTNRIFSGVLPGEAAQDQVLGRITANLTRGQKRDLAGLALDIAQSKGTTLEKLVKESPDEIDDALRVVVQYPRKGVLASPLARTLNLIFFPIRYNAKVTLVAAQALAKQPPSVQKAVLHSGFQMKEWLKSDEGIKWQSDHADAIQLFNWITPTNSIEATFKLLSGPESWGDFGSLGGLPLGFITQILDGQGIININKPYVNPKTGEVIPDYIPQTTKARASTALADLINSMFTYPGRTLGLPGKEASTRALVKKIVSTDGKDFEKRINTQDLTPNQQAWVRVIQGDTSPEALDALYTTPAPNQYQGYTLPPLDLPIRTLTQPNPAVPRRKGLPAKSGRGKKPKKIASPIPVR